MNPGMAGISGLRSNPTIKRIYVQFARTPEILKIVPHRLLPKLLVILNVVPHNRARWPNPVLTSPISTLRPPGRIPSMVARPPRC